MHNRNLLDDGSRSPWGSAWHLQPEELPEHPSGPIPIGPPLQVGSVPDDPSALTDSESTQTVPTVSVFDDPGPASSMPDVGVPISPGAGHPVTPVVPAPAPRPALPVTPAAAPAAPAELAGEDLERWFWTESEALADLGPKARFRSIRRLFRSR